MNAETIPSIGHNSGDPLKVGDDLTSHLETTYAEDVRRTQELLEKGSKYLTINSDDEDEKATEFMVAVRARYKASEASRVGEKTPYDDAAGRVHAFFKTKVLDLLGLAPTDKKTFDPVTRTDIGLGPRINMAQTIFKTAKAEAERKRREEEARIAAAAERQRQAEAAAAEAAARELERAAARKRTAESQAIAEKAAAEARRIADAAREAENKAAEECAAAQASAAAPLADMSRARGERGGVSSLREVADFRDLDRDKISLEALRPYFTDADLEKAVRGYMKANVATVNSAIKNGTSPIPGVVFFMSARSTGRA